MTGGGHHNEGPSSSSHINGGGPRLRLPPARSVGCESWIGRAASGGRGYDDEDVDYDNHSRGMQAGRHCKGGDDARER
jgi:hypothetical protein